MEIDALDNRKKYDYRYSTPQIIPLAPRLRTIHLEDMLRRAMSILRYRREQRGMAALLGETYQEASEG